MAGYSPVEAYVLLADFAQTDSNGKVNALGMGWSVTRSPTPHMAVIVFVRVGWNETNRAHHMTLSLLTADGKHAVTVPGPVGDVPLQIQGEFEAGRPAGLPQGSTIDHAFTINIAQALPLEPGRYEWRLVINDHEEETWRAAFVVNGSTSAPPS
jgi:hypothetical protein